MNNASTVVDGSRDLPYNPRPMNISVSHASIFGQKSPAIVLFTFENESVNGAPAPLQPLLKALSAKEFNGGARQCVMLVTAPGLPFQRVILAGLGRRDAYDVESIRRATGAVLAKLDGAGISQCAVDLNLHLDDVAVRDQSIAAIVEATVLASYKYTEFKPSPDKSSNGLKTLVLHVPPQLPRARAATIAANAQIVAESSNYSRAIGNRPGNVVTPAVLADYARKLSRETRLKCTILKKAELQRKGFGGLLAVGGGSANEPHLIVLEYNGARARNAKPVALVGKAITFDSGGISIKPSDKMDEMKFDKCGGVAVLGAMRAIAKMKLPIHVIAVIAAAENMPSATSYRPGDIVTSYRGTDRRAVTIEVLNTDAEGRIVLGDALVYARQRNPRAIIDLATLTGACVVALGSSAAGLLGNDEPLIAALREAGEQTAERCWPLPLWQDYKDKIKSDVADIKNTGGRYGGAITAAAFLAQYVDNTPWAHLDIAGTAWTTESHPYLGKGATGFGVRLLCSYLCNLK
jgi:leucyl aminopeptidase